MKIDVNHFFKLRLRTSWPVLRYILWEEALDYIDEAGKAALSNILPRGDKNLSNLQLIDFYVDTIIK